MAGKTLHSSFIHCSGGLWIDCSRHTYAARITRPKLESLLTTKGLLLVYLCQSIFTFQTSTSPKISTTHQGPNTKTYESESDGSHTSQNILPLVPIGCWPSQNAKFIGFHFQNPHSHEVLMAYKIPMSLLRFKENLLSWKIKMPFIHFQYMTVQNKNSHSKDKQDS